MTISFTRGGTHGIIRYMVLWQQKQFSREQIILLLTVALSAGLYYIFPRASLMQDVLTLVASFVVLPVVVVRFVLRQPLRTIGWRAINWRGGIVALLTAVAIAGIVAVALRSSVDAVTILPQIVRDTLAAFTWYVLLLSVAGFAYATFFGGVLLAALPLRRAISFAVVAVVLALVLLPQGTGLVGGVFAIAFGVLAAYHTQSLFVPAIAYGVATVIISTLRYLTLL